MAPSTPSAWTRSFSLLLSRRRSSRPAPTARPRRPRDRRPAVESMERRALLSRTAWAVDGPADAPGRPPAVEVGPSALAAPPLRPGWSRPGSPFAGNVRRNIAYFSDAGGTRLLDVYLPDGPPPPGGWPVVLAVHGGGWRKMSKQDYGPRLESLTDSGFAVVAPDYTLSRPGVPSWPRAILDLRGAVRWARANATRYGFDPGRIAAMGESAGGHLALLLGTMPDPLAGAGRPSARVQAVVSFYGPTDLSDLYLYSPYAAGPVRQFLGSTPATDPAEYADASPVTHVSPDDPPVLLVHGEADWLVPPGQSFELAARLNEAGVPNRLIVVPNGGHGFGLRVGGLDLDSDVVAFLAASMPPTRG